MLESIRNSLVAAKEIANLIIQIFNILKRYWGLFAVLALVGGIYIGLVIYCIYRPSEYIRRFYRLAENPETREDAWNLLYRPYRIQIWHDLTDFKSGFKTTIGYSNMSISYTKDPWNPAVLLDALLGEPLEYDVSFSVLDSFKTVDFDGDAQQDDLLWLHIAHKRTFNQLKEGKFGNPTNPEGSLEMTRTIRKKMELRESPTWVISKITTYDVSIKPSSD
jgi:hypothetical protein